MEVAAEAYQVIGVLAHIGGVFDDPEVTRALNYFGDIANGKYGDRGVIEILPFNPMLSAKERAFKDWSECLK